MNNEQWRMKLFGHLAVSLWLKKRPIRVEPAFEM